MELKLLNNVDPCSFAYSKAMEGTVQHLTLPPVDAADLVSTGQETSFAPLKHITYLLLGELLLLNPGSERMGSSLDNGVGSHTCQPTEIK